MTIQPKKGQSHSMIQPREEGRFSSSDSTNIGLSINELNERIQKVNDKIKLNQRQIEETRARVDQSSHRLNQLADEENSWDFHVIKWIADHPVLYQAISMFVYFNSKKVMMESIKAEEAEHSLLIEKNIETERLRNEELVSHVRFKNELVQSKLKVAEELKKAEEAKKIKESILASYQMVYQLFGGEKTYFKLPSMDLKKLFIAEGNSERAIDLRQPGRIEISKVTSPIMRFDGGFLIKDERKSAAIGPVEHVQFFFLDEKAKGASWSSSGYPLIATNWGHWMTNGKVNERYYAEIQRLIESVKLKYTED